jgi:probable phosphoglycerate mutase
MRQVTATGSQFVGPGKLVDVARLAHVWVSPRERAQQTYRLLFGGGGDGDGSNMADKIMTITEDIAEWDYGDYEGLVVGEIHALRKARGLDRERGWNIWKDGCEGGEYV